MREIKFRAWHETNKTMEYDKRWNGEDVKIVTPRGVLIKSASSGKWSLYSDRYMVIEEFTGLCDKNGKDIYEGDIVKPLNTASAGNFIHGVIAYGGGGFSVKADGNNWMFHAHSCLHLEIIGNIHENGDLLK